MHEHLSPSARPPRWTSPWSFFSLAVFRLFILMVLVFCVPTINANILEGCVETFNPETDYFPDKISPGHAEDFEITYYKNYKLLENSRTHEHFALYQCGTPIPTNLANNNTKIFPIPFSKLAITTTVEITFLELLGLRSQIKYISDPQYVTSTCVQKLVLSNEIQSLSYNETIKRQQLSQVDGIFEYTADPTNNKSISVSTSLDPGTLHRVSWIGFMAAFLNREAKANEVLRQITTRYDCVSGLSQTAPASPIVAWVDYYITYQIDVALYKQEFISDLGATPKAPVVNRFNNVADWKAAMLDVDIVIDQTYLGNMDTFYSNFNLSQNSLEYKFIKYGQVWRFDKLQSDFGGLDWFEGAVANADAVLQDLVTIVKPQIAFPHSRIWFRNSFINEPIVIEGEGKCLDPASPSQLRSDTCLIPTPTPTPTSFAHRLPPFALMLLLVVSFSLALAIY